jgi:hypothetical protein
MSFRAFDWVEFKKYVQKKYRKTTAKRVMCYANRYYQILESGNVGQLNAVPSTTRSEVIKSLIIISKYTGRYEQFKASLKSYGIKTAQPDALAAFVRIYSNTNSNLDELVRQGHAGIATRRESAVEVLAPDRATMQRGH